jgi:ketosteroid isomerase-like protein
MDEQTLRAWVEAYVRAWTSNDPTEIGALFTEDALYYTSPYEPAWRGRDGIVATWLERKDEPGGWTFRWEILAIAGDLGFVRGRTDYAATTDAAAETYSNLWVIRLDAAGRCAEFTEWWMQWPKSAA